MKRHYTTSLSLTQGTQRRHPRSTDADEGVCMAIIVNHHVWMSKIRTHSGERAASRVVWRRCILRYVYASSFSLTSFSTTIIFVHVGVGVRAVWRWVRMPIQKRRSRQTL